LLAEVSEVSDPCPADFGHWRKQAPANAVAAAVRLALCRRKARAKFSRPDRLWFNPVGLEQATSEVVALHKARRFDSSLVVDLCAGIGGDSLALARQATVLAIDSSRGMCRRLTWNAAAYDVAGNVISCQAHAETFAVPKGAWLHVDPDRRARRPQRARDLSDYSPALPFLLEAARSAPGGAIKLSPASDFEAHFRGPEMEVELISLHGECKEATVWFNAAATCVSRATRLPENATWTDRDGNFRNPHTIPISPVSAFVYDPDPALIRAGLLDSFAAAHGLCRIAPGIDYLTADRLVENPFIAAFAVQSVHRLDVRQLKRLVGGEGLGPLEIKVRGLKIAPESLRRQLRPRGAHPATLILAGGLAPARAILARRQKSSSDQSASRGDPASSGVVETPAG
jgi:hypothetical protein